MLALLDSLFEAVQGREPRAAFELTGRMKSDLLIVATLLPLAATDLRAHPPEKIGASDASNWGEAGVAARIPRYIGKELVRHTLRKSVWAKLLSPFNAILRSHDRLEPEDELPGDTSIETNPLWHALAVGLDYKLLFAKQKSGARHINIGETRAALKTERLLASAQPDSRVLLGLDSQVAIGTLCKGRASSPSLNAELARSLPTMLALNSYLEVMYYNTLVNRSDDPTRGKEIRKPSEPLPSWWTSAARGDFKELDLWLRKHGLDPMTLSGLPDLSELCGEVSPPGILPSYLQAELEPDKAANTARKSSISREPSPSSTSTARLPRKTVTFGRGGSGETGLNKAKQPEGKSLGTLSDEARSLLMDFPRGQVVLSPGEEWPPRKQGFLDLYSGERGVAIETVKMASTWVLCFDLEHSPAEDLNNLRLRQQLELMVDAGCFAGLGGGPVCASFSMAVRPPVRSVTEPLGKACMSEKMRYKVLEGNDMADWFFSLMRRALMRGMEVWMENPHTSYMFKIPSWYRLAADFPQLKAWVVDYCRFGTKWRKRTRFVCTSILGGMRTFCRCGGPHQVLKGRSKQRKMSWTRVAQAYPRGVARAVAYGLCSKLGLVAAIRDYDPAGMARCSHGRIGEAAHPGPRLGKHGPRVGVLEEVPLVETKTRVLQDKIWSNFKSWLRHSMSSGAVRSAMSHPVLLVFLAKEYGNFLYATGKSLYIFRHLLVFLQQNFITAKPFMGVCWAMVTRWERVEPTVHRVPLPFALFKTMLAVSLGWGWPKFAGILVLAFYGIARPGEPLSALRSQLVLPRDMLDEKLVAYLQVLKPKTRHRGRGLIQHLSVHEAAYVVFLDRVFGDLPSDSRLYRCTPGSFRRRWDAVLKALMVPPHAGLTPGGIRGGGCVHAFQSGLDLARLLWKMRIKHLETLEHYLQEVVASTVVGELPAAARSRISAAAAVLPFLLPDIAIP
eukprot:Skav224874  [mRNA]  locus=scaffold1112:121111:123981:+ [translate_table: standard]